MKISLDWLKDFMNFTETNVTVIAERITRSVAEVDAVEQQGALLNHCCVGKILSVERHPNADRLSICQVQTDLGEKRVVCGGTNLRVGMLVAFAHIGATVKWHGGELMTLEHVKIRGEASEGMICAAEELDLQSQFPSKPEDGEHPVIELQLKEKEVGKPLVVALGLNDTILHIDNHAITHRADLFSHLGFARECVALGLATWKKHAEPVMEFGTAPLPFTVHIDCPAQIPRHAGCLLEIDGMGETPDWMKRRLEATGFRSLNLPIDITNFVAMELGTPLHSFDADDFRGDLHMRLSKKGEKIVTLDHVERVLPEGAIIISDDAGIFDLLGIMGGLRSSTKQTTRRIYLQNPSLDPIAIRRAIVGTGHRTEAATIFEKGVPPAMVEIGLRRAIQLFLEFVPGARIVSELETQGEDGTPRTLTLRADRVASVLGKSIEPREISTILKNLGFAVNPVKGKKGLLTVTTPLTRLNDMREEIDLIEEVGRIHGYDKIDAVLPIGNLHTPTIDARRDLARFSLKETGYTELIPLSLVSAELLERSGFESNNALTIENPIGADLSLLQTSALPRLLEHAQANRLLAEELQTFTIGHVFGKHIREHAELALLCFDTTKHTEASALLHTPILRLRQHLISLASDLDLELAIEPTDASLAVAHPGRTAKVMIATETIGTMFELHPTIIENFDLPERTAAAIIDFSALTSASTKARALKVLSPFPAVQYDVTFTRTDTSATGKLLEKVRAADPLLEDVQVMDLYTGAPLTNGDFNLTLRFTYRALDRTLTEEEAQKVHANVLHLVEKN